MCLNTRDEKYNAHTHTHFRQISKTFSLNIKMPNSVRHIIADSFMFKLDIGHDFVSIIVRAYILKAKMKEE